MRAKSIFIFCLVTMFLGNAVLAQNAAFINNGQIEYIRKINTFQALGKIMGSNERVTAIQLQTMVQNQRENGKQFDTASFVMAFNDSTSLYKPVNSQLQTSAQFQIPISYNNTVFLNLHTKEILANKNLVDQKYFVKDTLKHIHWKLTEESRDILGFHCYRANALLNDSTYVVAFYTDQIIPKGGPESFTGLPGMILEVALPHQNIVWLATKVQATTQNENEITSPFKKIKKTIAASEYANHVDEFLKAAGFANSAWALNFSNY